MTRTRTAQSRRTTALLAALVAVAVAAPGIASAQNRRTFATNSLIIPTQMEYQTDCGMTSAYGLIYTILYKNADRVAAGKRPITVYWAIDSKKQSHHRCDTATNATPDTSTYNDNDGCDFAVQSATGQPVARLATDNTQEAPFNVYSTTYNKTAGTSARSSTKDRSIGASTTVVKYSGGLWVIDAVDRAAVLELLASDTMVRTFRTSTVNCTRPSSSYNGNYTPLGGTHYVEIHSARASFTVPVAKVINEKPPLLALVGAKAVSILEDYLENAGLSVLTGAAGTIDSHGIIYDVLEPVTDFVSTTANPYGAVNMPDPNDPNRSFYQVLWAPHWEATSQSVIPPTGSWIPSGGETAVENALRNIARFADAGNGVFAECASIASLEGTYKEGSTGVCSNTFQCECLDRNDPPACVFGDIQPAVATCDAGFTSACGKCFRCDSGTLDVSVCGEEKCVVDPPICTNSRYSMPACGTCWRTDDPCPSDSWTADYSVCPPVCRRSGRTPREIASRTPSTVEPTESAGIQTCMPNFTKVCVDLASAIDEPGSIYSRFQATNKLYKNGIQGLEAGSGMYVAPDCTDGALAAGSTKYKATTSPIPGDCMDYHPDGGGPGNLFSQKGNYNFVGTWGHTNDYIPPNERDATNAVGSFYRPGVFHFATSRNAGKPANANWDFTTARHKDGDPSKGMVVYLAGHTYADNPAGNRIVLNTLLNLGFSDSAVELARSEPVGYVTWGADVSGNPVVAAQTVFQGTYEQHPPPVMQDWINYTVVSPKSWRFPFIDGHFRAYDLMNISSSVQDFRDNALWDATLRLPLPADRNIFTTVAGNANLGWKKIDFKYTETAQGTCLANPGVIDEAGNAVCYLSDALTQCSTAGINNGQLLDGDLDPSGASRGALLGMFVQQVRGHCSAHDPSSKAPILVPADTECDDKISKWQSNRARLGGVDHSSAAIVGPTPYLHDETMSDGRRNLWSQRPVVAYFGARDGMLHAVYVSGGATFEAGGARLPAGITGGKELWAFVPPGQVCGLSTNTAMVDANVNVMDVFGNFPRDVNGDGVFDLTSSTERPNGVREWRTILISTAGEGAAEIFAMDVTNPLRPVLLWHVAGKFNNDDRWDMNGDGDFADNTDHMDKAKPATYASKWFNSNDGTQGTAAWIPTDYNSTNATVLNGIKFGKYDYRNLGFAYGTAIGTLWSGNAFNFATFVATSTADFVTDPDTPLGYKGIEVFAIDIPTGQKIWQWQNRYTRKNAASTVIADNNIPGRVALIDVDHDGSVDRVYVGDYEGHMWELAATDGRNLNYLPQTGGGGYRSYPFYGTPAMSTTGVDADALAFFRVTGGTALAQQPLTSPIGIGRFTEVPTALEPYLKNRMAVAQGTMGVDWSIAPTQAGHVYVAPAFPEQDVRYVAPISTAVSPDPLLAGIVLPAAIWDTQLNVGERVYGMPKILGNEMFVNTSYGSFTGDITNTLDDLGRTLRITAAGKTSIDDGQKRFGGALMIGSEVVVTSDVGIVRKSDAVPPSTIGTRVRDRFTPTAPKSWEQRPDGNPPFLP